MRKILMVLMLMLSADFAFASQCSELLNTSVRTLGDKTEINLCEAYQGKVLLVVNTASRCAYTDQYGALEKLYDEYQTEGLVVLGFPSNDFGQQEPGTEKQIKDFCRLTYGVKFPMFSKTHVAKNKAGVFYQKLAQVSGTFPRWNFHKFLIGRNGELYTQYASAIDPLDDVVIEDIEKLLRQSNVVSNRVKF